MFDFLLMMINFLLTMMNFYLRWWIFCWWCSIFCWRWWIFLFKMSNFCWKMSFFFAQVRASILTKIGSNLANRWQNQWFLMKISKIWAKRREFDPTASWRLWALSDFCIFLQKTTDPRGVRAIRWEEDPPREICYALYSTQDSLVAGQILEKKHRFSACTDRKNEVRVEILNLDQFPVWISGFLIKKRPIFSMFPAYPSNLSLFFDFPVKRSGKLQENSKIGPIFLCG